MNNSVSIDIDDAGSDAAGQSAVGQSTGYAHTVILVLMIGLPVLFFGLTSPQSVPSVVLIAGFVALGMVVYASLRLLMRIGGLDRRLTAGRRRAVLLTGTLLPVLLLMMQSVGQLTLRDVLTLSGLFLIGIFYVARVGRSAHP